MQRVTAFDEVCGYLFLVSEADAEYSMAGRTSLSGSRRRRRTVRYLAYGMDDVNHGGGHGVVGGISMIFILHVHSLALDHAPGLLLLFLPVLVQFFPEHLSVNCDWWGNLK